MDPYDTRTDKWDQLGDRTRRGSVMNLLRSVCDKSSGTGTFGLSSDTYGGEDA